MSSPDCNTPDVVGCVRYKPNLAFGIFTNTPMFVSLVWVLFLTYQGILRFTGAEGLGDFMRFLYYGVTGTFTSVIPSNKSISEGIGIQTSSLSGGWVGILLYLASLITIVALGTYWKDSPILGTFVLAMILGAAFIVYFTETDGAMQVVGGILMGLIIVGIIWVVNFFSLEKDNEFGNMIMILIMIWLGLTFFAYYGSKYAPKKKQTITTSGRGRGRPALNRIIDDSGNNSKIVVVQGGGERGIQNKPNYPLAKWLNQFKKNYNKISKEKTGANAPGRELEDAWRRAVPIAKSNYDEYSVANMDDIAAQVYRG